MWMVSCFTSDQRQSVPELAFIMAGDEARALEPARRERLDSPSGVAVAFMENGRANGVLRRDGRLDRFGGASKQSPCGTPDGAAAGHAPIVGAATGMGSGEATSRTLVVHALLLGERMDTTGLERDQMVATIPLSFRLGARGFVALFRYGAAVFVDVEPERQAETLRDLASRISAAEQTPEEETATIIIQPDQEEQITPSGAIQLREAASEHLLVVADVLAKSVALARDERRVAAVFDAIEPFANTLAFKGRPPRTRRRSILRLIGTALLAQHRVSGRVAVREKPDILWDRPDLERLYSRLEDEYELVERTETLDRKLAVISSSTTAFIDLQDTDRSLRLEAIIVILILAELIVASFQVFGAILHHPW